MVFLCFSGTINISLYIPLLACFLFCFVSYSEYFFLNISIIRVPYRYCQIVMLIACMPSLLPPLLTFHQMFSDVWTVGFGCILITPKINSTATVEEEVASPRMADAEWNRPRFPKAQTSGYLHLSVIIATSPLLDENEQWQEVMQSLDQHAVAMWRFPNWKWFLCKAVVLV